MTLKGRRLVEEADVLIYAGSLVNPEVMKWRKEEAEIHNSASMTLDEVIEVMLSGLEAGKKAYDFIQATQVFMVPLKNR